MTIFVLIAVKKSSVVNLGPVPSNDRKDCYISTEPPK